MKVPDENGWSHETAWAAVLASFVSVIAFLFYFRSGEILLYGDAVAHINIARRVFDSRTPGLLQLGTVWLPFFHLLMIPFIAWHAAWQTGIGGSLPSMAAYVFGVAGIFRLLRKSLSAAKVTDTVARSTAGVAAAIYGLNPNLLYLQSTAMTESLYLALFVWAVVYFSEFLQSVRNSAWIFETRRILWKCAGCLMAACLTRYDGWFLAAAIALGVTILAWRSDSRVARRTAGIFSLLAAAAPLFWFAYNAAVYRNPLEFANGPYSARAIEQRTAIPGSSPHPGAHNPLVAGLYFLKAAKLNVAEGTLQGLWLLLAVVGLIPLALDRRLWPLGLLWIPLPFYVLSIAYGSVPIYVPSWWPHSLYNLRYGVQLLPALAVFLTLAAKYLLTVAPSRYGKWVFAVLIAAVVAASYVSVWKAEPVCYREASINSRTRLQLERALAEQLLRLPPNSTLLMYLGEHVGALQDAGIPLKRAINEGNHRVWKQPADPEGLWERALADPAQHVGFAVAFEGDPVWKAVHARGFSSVVIIAVNGQQRATVFRTR